MTVIPKEKLKRYKNDKSCPTKSIINEHTKTIEKKKAKLLLIALNDKSLSIFITLLFFVAFCLHLL